MTPVLHLGVVGYRLILLRLTRNSYKLASLRPGGGLVAFVTEVGLPPVTGADLAEIVRHKTATTGSLDGWGWRELKIVARSLV